MRRRDALEAIRQRLAEPDAIEYVPIHILADIDQIIFEYPSMVRKTACRPS